MIDTESCCYTLGADDARHSRDDHSYGRAGQRQCPSRLHRLKLALPRSPGAKPPSPLDPRLEAATKGCANRGMSGPVSGFPRVCSGLGQEVEVLLARRHGVDDHLVAVLKDEDDGLQ